MFRLKINIWNLSTKKFFVPHEYSFITRKLKMDPDSDKNTFAQKF